METSFLTIIIPAYNEELRLPISLPKIIDFVKQQSYAIDVIVVDDGSADKTADVVRQYSEQAPFLSLLQVEHGGKGHAVRAGMLHGCGKYLFICDSDLSMPISEVSKFIPPQLADFDIAIGSREIAGAIRYDEPPYRHVMGRVFNFLVNTLLSIGLEDTQAGFKCFERSIAHELFSLQTIPGWAFDVEILFLARQHELRIKEVPINWYYQSDSRIRPVTDTFNMIKELLRIRFKSWRGRYSRVADSQIEVVKTNQ